MKKLLYLLMLLPGLAMGQRTSDQLPSGAGSQAVSWFSLNPADTTGGQLWAALGGGKSRWIPTYRQMINYVAANAPVANITAGTILILPTVGQVIPSGTPDQVWNAMYRPPLPPTAALSGGATRQFSGSNLTHNLSWSYGRQATTATISTAVITPGSFNVFSTQPSQPGTVSGSQSVTTTANTNTTYTITVTASDGKVTMATTADNWQPFLYAGTCAGTTPTSAEVLAAITKALSGGSAYNMNLTFTGSNLHIFYAYYSTYTTITSAKDGAGNQIIGAMTLATQSITDNGFSGTWKTITTNNTYTNANIVINFL